MAGMSAPEIRARLAGAPAGGADSYVLGHGEAETRRLIHQHQVYSPITRRLFEAAGSGAGMRVLEVGSGAGDAAPLLADLVGPRGQVVGVDMNADILDVARARARAGALSPDIRPGRGGKP